MRRSIFFTGKNVGSSATLTAIANGHPQSRIDDLLPWNFKPSS